MRKFEGPPLAADELLSGVSGTGARFEPVRITSEVFFASVLLLPGILYPLALDQGMFALAGQILLDGDLPYRDLVDQKGPALYYALAGVMALAGESQWVVRLTFFAFTLIGALCAAELGGRLAGRAARVPCLIFYCLTAVQGSAGAPWTYGQAEDVTAALSLFAILLLVARGPGTSVAAGFLLGLTPWFKLTAAVPAAAIAGVWLLTYRFSARRDPEWGPIGQFCLAFLVPSIGFMGLMLLRGNWGDFWDVVVMFNLEYSSTTPAGIDLRGLLDRLGLLCLVALPGVPLLWRASRTKAALLLTFLATSVLVVLVEGKFFLYHVTPVVAALVVPAGLAVAHLVHWLRRRGPRHASTVGAGLVCVIGLLLTPQPLITALTFARTAAVASGTLSLESFRAPYRVSSVTAGEMANLVEYIRARTEPTDQMLILGHEGVASFLMDRRPPSRHVALPSLFRDDSRAAHARRNEMTQEVLSEPPLYIILPKATVHYEPHITPTEALRRIPALNALVNERYDLEAVVHGFVLHRRRPTERLTS